MRAPSGDNPEYVSDAVIETLVEFGCRYLPLNPGASFRGLHDSLVNFSTARGTPPQYILCTHEEISVAIAHAYSKATGSVGWAVVHDLVGLMHASMAVFNAWCDSAPLVVLGGSGPFQVSRRRPIDWNHSASVQAELVRPYTKWDAEPTEPQELLDAVAQAWQAASSPRTGPTYVTVDAGLQEDRRDTSLAVPTREEFAQDADFVPAQGAIDEVAQLLRAARFPLIVGGRVGLDPDATDVLTPLLEVAGAAYWDERNFVSIPTDHPQNLTGDHGVLELADLVVLIDPQDPNHLLGGGNQHQGGVRSPAGYEGAVVLCTSAPTQPSGWADAQSAPIFARHRLVGDPLTTAKLLCDRLAEHQRNEELPAGERTSRLQLIDERRAALRSRREAAYREGWDEQPISVPRMTAELHRSVEHLDWLLVTRNTRSWPEGLWRFTGAGQYLGHSGGGGIGYGPGAMVGGALAARDRGQLPIGIIGDGDLLAGPTALWTAAHHEVPLLVVVHNNRSFFNDEEHQQVVAEERGRPVGRAHLGTTLIDPEVDLSAMARSFGAWATGPIRRPEELYDAFNAAIAEAQAGRVALVDVHTAPA